MYYLKKNYKNKVNLFKEKLNSYKKNRQEKIDLVTKKKMNATANLLKEINPILSELFKKKWNFNNTSKTRYCFS